MDYVQELIKQCADVGFTTDEPTATACLLKYAFPSETEFYKMLPTLVTGCKELAAPEVPRHWTGRLFEEMTGPYTSKLLHEWYKSGMGFTSPEVVAAVLHAASFTYYEDFISQLPDLITKCAKVYKRQSNDNGLDAARRKLAQEWNSRYLDEVTDNVVYHVLLLAEGASVGEMAELCHSLQDVSTVRGCICKLWHMAYPKDVVIPSLVDITLQDNNITTAELALRYQTDLINALHTVG